MELGRRIYKTKKNEGGNVKVATIGTVYQIEPVSGIDEVIYNLKSVFDIKKAKCIVCTYSYNPDIIGLLSNIFPTIRVFAGKGFDGMIRGAYMTKAQIHFKCIIAWTNEITVSYIGSSNLAAESGGNYGLLFMKKVGIDGFNTSLNTKNYREWHDPIEVIISEIVARETGSRCEMCEKPANILWLDDYAKFVCENCK